MGFIVGIRQVLFVEVFVEGDGRRSDTGRFPGTSVMRREETAFPSSSWARLLHFQVELPTATGAGPCGTRGRSPCGRSAMAWSIRHLVDPLAAYYATYEPPMRFGAKSTPRGRRTA